TPERQASLCRKVAASRSWGEVRGGPRPGVGRVGLPEGRASVDPRPSGFTVGSSGPHGMEPLQVLVLPAREREGEDGRAARLADRAAGHADALADADDAQPAALGCPGERVTNLEAGAVVGDAHVDRAAAGPEADLDLGRARVLADVREGLLDRPEDRDPLRGV